MERAIFDPETLAEEITLVRVAAIVKDRYPELDEEDQESVPATRGCCREYHPPGQSSAQQWDGR